MMAFNIPNARREQHRSAPRAPVLHAQPINMVKLCIRTAKTAASLRSF